MTDMFKLEDDGSKLLALTILSVAAFFISIVFVAGYYGGPGDQKRLEYMRACVAYHTPVDCNVGWTMTAH